jgi:hypothetical protein
VPGAPILLRAPQVSPHASDPLLADVSLFFDPPAPPPPPASPFVTYQVTVRTCVNL